MSSLACLQLKGRERAGEPEQLLILYNNLLKTVPDSQLYKFGICRNRVMCRTIANPGMMLPQAAASESNCSAAVSLGEYMASSVLTVWFDMYEYGIYYIRKKAARQVYIPWRAALYLQISGLQQVQEPPTVH